MLMFNFKPFPGLQTERLVLRPLGIADVEEIFLLRTTPQVIRYIERPAHQDKNTSLEWIKNILQKVDANESVQWAIVPKGGEKLIGTVCLWNLRPEKAEGEIGYDLLPEHWGKGYMQEVVSAVINYGFNTLGLTAIDAYTQPENLASVKLLKRNGFINTGKDAKSKNAVFVLKNPV